MAAFFDVVRNNLRHATPLAFLIDIATSQAKRTINRTVKMPSWGRALAANSHYQPSARGFSDLGPCGFVACPKHHICKQWHLLYDPACEERANKSS